MTGILSMLIGQIYGGSTPVTSDPYFEYTTLLLPGNGTNGAQNNTFLDSSTNNFTITRNGNTTQGTFSPFSQTGWGNYFGGSGNYLKVADGTALDLPGDFTLEGWFYFSSLSSNNGIIGYGSEAASQNGFSLYWAASSVNKLRIYSNGAALLTGTTTLSANTWNHIAIVRSGSGSNNLTVYVNGAVDQTATNTTSFTGVAALGMGIGVNYDGTFYNPFTGYASNIRLVKGQALATGAFTPPTSPVSTSSVGWTGANAAASLTGTVSVLTCQSNRFVDNSSSPLAITVTGSPSVQAFSPFNPTASWSAATYGGSGYFDGNGDYLTLGGQSAFVFGTGDFTIEMFAYVTNTANTIFDLRPSTPSGAYITIYMTGGVIYYYANGANQINGGTLPLNQWVHIVASRVSSNTRLFINGVQAGLTYSDTTNYTTSGSRPIIGADGNVTGSSPMIGYLSNLRVVKGSGVTSVTVPTTPLTAITNTSLLLNFTNAGIYDATSKNDLETVGNAQISTTQSKWGGSSISFDGTGDWLLIPDQPPQRIGTGNFTVEMWVYRNSSGTYGLAGKGTGTTGWLVSLNSSNQVVFTYGSSTITSSGTVSATTWTHIAVVREGTSTNQTKIYISGTNDGTGTVSTDFNQTNSMYIGADRTGGSAANAYVQDVRITNYARYTANFTPPTAAFPTL